MAISIEQMKGLLARFTLLFPVHQEARDAFPILPEIWAGLMSNFSEDEVIAAARQLALKLRRFPVPADFVEQIESALSAEESTHA